MADSNISAKDAADTTKTLDAQDVGGELQQTVTLGDGITPGRVAGVDAAGNLAVRERAASTGTHTNVAASASAVTVLAANTARIGAAITNESTATLYLRVGAGTVTATSYTVALGPGDYYELPARYTGIVSGIWSAADGAARVAEWT